MGELGRAALLLTLGLSAWAAIAGAAAAAKRRRRLAESARNALVASLVTTLIAAAVLVAAFVRRDFSFIYVADHSNRTLPLAYTVSAFWSGQEGSLLLWLVLLCAYGASVVWLNRRRHQELLTWVVPTLGAIQVFFAFMVVAIASPFAQQPAPADGSGMNASLQNPYMLAHPVFLYLGYVGLTIPFAFAMGALLSRRTDEVWIIMTRRWTLAAWAFLGVGQLLGAHWAYEEIGWGGYYGWDPVENAALMPWLAATAFLHSVMVQEKKGMLKVWNIVLVILTFSLSLFGTFLTRSGVIQSVHSFAQSPIGPWFIGFIVVVVCFSLAVFFARLPLLKSQTRLESLASREATFLYNNLLLVAFSLTILWGVLYPLLSLAVRGETRTVSRPYYDFFLRSFGLPLLLLMGIGPLVAWRRTSLRALGRTFAIPAVIAFTTGVALLLAGAGSSRPGLIAYTFSAFVLASILLEFGRGTRARRSLGDPNWALAFTRLVGRNRRRYGGYVVHAAVVLLAIGVAGSSAYQTQREAKVAVGHSLTVGQYSLAYRSLKTRMTHNAREVRALVDVYHGGSYDGRITPGKNEYFPVAGLFSNEVAIRSNWLTGEDLYVVADQINKDGSIDFKVWVKPLVNLIWLGGLVFVLGSLVAMWPDAVEQRALAARYTEARLKTPSTSARGAA